MNKLRASKKLEAFFVKINNLNLLKIINMSKTLNEIQVEIENIAKNIAKGMNTLSLNQVIDLMKQSIKDLGKLKLEEDNEG